MRSFKTILFILFTINSYSQGDNYRKAILKSDVIIVSNNYTYDTLKVNDFSKKVYLKINKVDKVLKNKLSITLKSITATVFQDGEDFYSSIYNPNYMEAIDIIQEIDENEEYYNVFFLKKEKDNYVAYLIFENISSSSYLKYSKQINTLITFESIIDEKDRYDRTLDWFIDNRIMPDKDFIDYYKQKNIIKGSIQYSDIQYKKALELFKNGGDTFLPMLKEKYFDEVKAYYVHQMEDILKISDPDYSDFYKFSRLADAITNDYNNEYNSVNTLMDDLLTNTCYDDYKKEAVMKHLLKVVKEWELFPKE